MTETQTLASQTPETQEVEPNAPEWVYPADLADEERERLTSEMTVAFKTVYDPEIPCDVYELGLVYKVEIDDARFVRLDMTLTAPGCPVAGELSRAMEVAVETVSGTSGASVSIVFEPPWTPGRMSEEARVALDMY
jgi:FeS assembly SUF system protein